MLKALVTEARLLVEALPSGTVETFLHVLTSKITQYDQNIGRREAKKGRLNIYRLGHLLAAKQNVADAVKDVLYKEDAESLGLLKKAILKHFSSNLPPAKAVLKQIDAFISDKVLPTLRGK